MMSGLAMSGLAISDRIEKAISDEWMAHYQYWLGSVLLGDRYENVVLEFVEHSSDEYDHATDLAVWLRKHMALAGEVPLSLEVLLKSRHCGYVVPVMNDPHSLIQDAIKGERCAIQFYNSILGVIAGKEYHTLDEMLEWILGEEKKHLSDLEKLLREI